MAEEVTKAVVKKARKGHRNPIQLLGDSSIGDKRATALYREYATFTAGRRQLEWSRTPNLKEIAGVLELSDEEIMDKHEESAVMLACLPITAWHKVLRVNGVGDLLHMAESGNISEFYAWLYDICGYAPSHDV